VRAGLPFRDGLALTSAPAGAPRSEGAELVAMDRVSRLALVRVSANPAPVRVWSRPRTAAARYLVAADMSSGELFLRPVFVGPLTDVRAPAWRGDIWALSETTDLSDGTFVFALDGSLAGLAVTAADGRALVPADTLLAAAGALAQSERPPCGDLGIQVQALLPRVKEAIGSDGALAVAWVDPRGPAAGQLATADVLQALDGETVNSIDDWRARMERVAPGELVQLRVQRGGQAIDVAVTAREKPAAADERALGLRLRNRNNLGAEVTAVDRGSAAARAGVVPGDLITMIGEVPAPTPDDVRRVFKAAAGRPVLAAVTRGDDHLLVALEKAP
jgi:serine protease Do